MATLKEALIGTEEQNKQGQANLDKVAQMGSGFSAGLAKFLGGKEKPEPVKPEEPKPEIKKAKGGKVMKNTKKFADGGDTGLMTTNKVMKMMGRQRSSVDELQDMLPSKEGIGRVMRSKMNPEVVKTAMNPVGYVAEKVYDRLKDTTVPRSYDKEMGMKKGGTVKKMAKGGSASSRADGCAIRGKTRA